MKVFIRLLIALLLLGGIFGGIFGYKYFVQMQGGGPGGPRPANITATTVASEQWQGERSSVGSLTAVDRVAVSTEVAGTIESLNFDSGERVDTNDVLVALDTDVDEAELQGLQAEAELARIEFNRAEDLLPQRAISQSEFDEARARLDSATAAVDTQQARLAQKTIRAPFPGILGLRTVSVGQYLAPGSDIVEIQRLDPIYADFTLPERFLTDLEQGQSIEVNTSAFEDTFNGTITAIDSAIRENTRAVSVRATLDNTDGRLRPGMFAEVTVLEPMERTLLTIPRTAVSFNTYGDFVLRINQSDNGLVAERVQIETGEVRDGRVEVTSGLDKGDRVVAAGLVKVRPGQPVTIDDTVMLNPDEVTGR
ncbi:efflux RND transporter periplasmic adaptor subunit [Gammaproteobacteria bacterium 2W06]|nr:efflux RND transporter periplasmic adaptor subunit [Gammaproteobacteria bacterium 2W06]